MPPDGLPLYQEWLNTCQDLVRAGYESAREPIELCHSDPDGKVTFLSLKVCKGLGRVSIIWFAVLFSYFKLRDSMTSAMKDDFCRPGLGYSGGYSGGTFWVAS